MQREAVGGLRNAAGMRGVSRRVRCTERGELRSAAFRRVPHLGTRAASRSVSEAGAESKAAEEREAGSARQGASGTFSVRLRCDLLAVVSFLVLILPFPLLTLSEMPVGHAR